MIHGINWQEVFRIILGEMALEHFVAYYGLMCLGALAFFGVDVAQSKNTDPGTPRKFSWKFLVKDNILRAVSVAIIMAAVVIWYDSFFGVELNAKLAFMQGMSIDAITGTVLKYGKTRGAMKKQRDKLTAKYG